MNHCRKVLIGHVPQAGGLGNAPYSDIDGNTRGDPDQDIEVVEGLRPDVANSIEGRAHHRTRVRVQQPAAEIVDCFDLQILKYVAKVFDLLRSIRRPPRDDLWKVT